MEYDKAVDAQNALTAKRDELEAGGIEQLEQEYAAAMSAVDAVKDADEATFNNNENWNEVISYLESESVASLIVSSVTSSNDTLSLTLTVGSKEEAAKLLLQLQKIPYFGEVSVSSITETEDENGKKTVSFSVILTYKNPGADTNEGEGE